MNSIVHCSCLPYSLLFTLPRHVVVCANSALLLQFCNSDSIPSLLFLSDTCRKVWRIESPIRLQWSPDCQPPKSMLLQGTTTTCLILYLPDFTNDEDTNNHHRPLPNHPIASSVTPVSFQEHFDLFFLVTRNELCSSKKEDGSIHTSFSWCSSWWGLHLSGKLCGTKGRFQQQYRRRQKTNPNYNFSNDLLT